MSSPFIEVNFKAFETRIKRPLLSNCLDDCEYVVQYYKITILRSIGIKFYVYKTLGVFYFELKKKKHGNQTFRIPKRGPCQEATVLMFSQIC